MVLATQIAQVVETPALGLTLCGLFETMQTEMCIVSFALVVYMLMYSEKWAALVGLKKPPASKHIKSKCLVKDSREEKRRQRPAATDSGVPESMRLTKLIRELGREKKLDEAKVAFDQLKGGRPSATSHAYNSILEACVYCNDMQSALEYLGEAKAAQIADVVSYNTVMKGHLSIGDIRAAQRLLTEMTRAGLAASHVTFHSLLNASVQAGDRHAVWCSISKMNDAGLQPTPITCSILLKLAVSPDYASDVTKVLTLVQKMTVSIDECLFLSIVEACLKTHSMNSLAALLKECKAKGLGHRLTSPTYGSMIKAFGQMRNLEQVWALWKEMREYGVQPSIITVGCVVDALVMNGSTDHAWQLVHDLWTDASTKELVNTVIYSTIAKGFAITKRLDKVLALYDEMRERSIGCNTITYNTMLNALVRCGDLQRMPQLLDDMRSATPKVEPDMITYSTIMKGYCSSGDLDKGLALLLDMESDCTFTPDEVMYNSLLEGCAKQHRLDKAIELLDKMRAQGVLPSNYTLSIMIKLLGRSKRLNQAFAMVKEMVDDHGLRPNIFVYTSLIQACFQNRQLGKALELHDKIVSEGCVFDEKAYTSLAQGCLKSGAVDKAAEVVRCAFGLGGHALKMAPGAAVGVEWATVQQIIEKLRTSGKVKVADQLTGDIDSRGPRRNMQQRPHATPAPWKRSIPASATALSTQRKNSAAVDEKVCSSTSASESGECSSTSASDSDQPNAAVA